MQKLNIAYSATLCIIEQSAAFIRVYTYKHTEIKVLKPFTVDNSTEQNSHSDPHVGGNHLKWLQRTGSLRSIRLIGELLWAHERERPVKGLRCACVCLTEGQKESRRKKVDRQLIFSHESPPLPIANHLQYTDCESPFWQTRHILFQCPCHSIDTVISLNT